MKINPNDTYSVTLKFTQEQVNNFAEVTGDKNPVHIDPEYGKKTMFGRNIVHGFLSGSIFSKVFGTEWPGEGTIYLSQSMTFKYPAFVEETYTAVLRCKEVYPEKHRGIIECILKDEEGKVIIEGEAMLKHNLYF